MDPGCEVVTWENLNITSPIFRSKCFIVSVKSVKVYFEETKWGKIKSLYFTNSHRHQNKTKQMSAMA